MLLFLSIGGLLGMLATQATAGPVAVRVPQESALQERMPSLHLGSYDLTTSHVDDVLFSIGFGTTSGRVGDAYKFTVECVDCRTWGSAVISTTGVNKNDDVLQDIIEFFKNPVDCVVNAFSMDVKIDFQNVGGHFDFLVEASDTVSYSIPIFETQTPAGIAVSEDVSFGLVLSVDLVFSLTTKIDLEAGFEFSFPEGAYITVDPISGDILDHGFTGADITHLPVVVVSGSATFMAALRVRVQAGTTVEVFGTGFDFELGVYADLIEYIATIGTNDQCELYITESVDCNIGAYAHAVVEIDYLTFGASPNVVTTLLDYPLPSLCLTRPVETSLTAFPTTAPISLITSGAPGFATTVSVLPTPASSPSLAFITPTATSTPGGVFIQGSSTSDVLSVLSPSPTLSSTSGILSVLYPSPSLSTNDANATITSLAMTTSTVISTDWITVTSCASTILHCPASLASEIVITSTTVLYTTVCPVGAVLPTTLPFSSSPASVSASSSAAAVVVSSATVSPTLLVLTPCATPIVSTIYTPTFVNPTYVMPTATSFSIPNPYWNVTTTYSSTVQVKSTVTAAGVLSPTPAVGGSGGKGNSTVAGTTAVAKPSATSAVPFTGNAGRVGGSVGAVVIVLVACVWGL